MKRAVTVVSAGAGVAATGAFIAGVTVNRVQAAYSYLFGFVYVWSIAIGALFLLMIGHSSNAVWFVPIRRPCERIVSTLPLIVLLLAPLLLFWRDLYPWMHWQTLPGFERAYVKSKLVWLNPSFFAARALAYAAIQAIFGETLQHWSAQQDRAANDEQSNLLRERMVRTSVGGMVVLAFIVTFASWDWIMSLEPAWYSNLYGVYIFSGGLLSALGLLGAYVVLAVQRRTLPNAVASSHFHAIGRLQLAMVVFWAYIGWCHVLQQWIANLPLEALWYLKRWYHGWQWEGLALIFLHFAIPFVLLLFRPIKKNRWTFAIVSLWLVLVHAIDVHYLILPVLHRQRYELHWLDFAAVIAVSSLTICFGSLRGRHLAATPRNDPLLEPGLAYESRQ